MPASTLRRSRPSAPSRAWWPVTTASKPRATARSSTAANLIFSLQRRHGLGVRPAAYSATKSSTTSVVELLGQVPDVERDADHVGGAAGVPGVLQRAAAAGAGAVGLRVAGQRQVDAGHVVPGVDRPGGRHRRVDPARHGRQHPHATSRAYRRAPADSALSARDSAGQRRARRAGPLHRAGQRGDQRVDVGSGGGVAEREPQRRAGPRVVGAHRQQHVRGLRHPGRAGRAGGAGDAGRVEQQQQRVALAAGEGEVGVAGQPVRPGRR